MCPSRMATMSAPRKHPQELRDRALRLAVGSRKEAPGPLLNAAVCGSGGGSALAQPEPAPLRDRIPHSDREVLRVLPSDQPGSEPPLGAPAGTAPGSVDSLPAVP